MKFATSLVISTLVVSALASHGAEAEAPIQRRALHQRAASAIKKRAAALPGVYLLSLGKAVTAASNKTTAATNNSTKAVAPKTKAAAKPKMYNSTGLWYSTDGQPGACKKIYTDADYTIALPMSQYPDANVVSPLCGRMVIVKSLRRSVVVVVADSSGNNYTILSKAAFAKLGQLDAGMAPITYTFLPHGSNLTTPAAAKVVVTPSSALKKAKVTAAAVPTSKPDQGAVKSASAAAAAASASASKKSADDAAYESSVASVSSESSMQSAEAAASAASASSVSSEEAASAWYASSSSSSAAAAASKAAKKAKADAANNNNNGNGGDNNGNGGDNNGGGGGGGGEVHSGGFATYYTQNGVAGNCGQVYSDSDKIIALPTAMYAGGSHCGKQIRITRVSNGAQVTATVRDSCPTCINNECLDLSVSAFTAIATEEEGQVAITWQWA